MGIDSKNQTLKQIRRRKFLNKDFSSFRADLTEYAKSFYGAKDLSEVGVTGMLLDAAAYIGDVHSFYLDHQFSELFAETAVESANIERALREAGVDIVGASPAVAIVHFLIEVPAQSVGTVAVPQTMALPIIEQDTIVAANNGIQFFLIEDIDYSETDELGNLKASSIVGATNANGSPATFILSSPGVCISGQLTTENFQITETFVPFREITLANTDITEVLSVTDTVGNIYYEVTGLTQDTVFRRIPNRNPDGKLVKEALELVPAPYRYVKKMDPQSRITTLTFGGGSASTLDDDIIPDPSEFAISLYGKKTFSRFTLDPNQLLQTRTLGVAATSTTLRIIYRYGGGLSHNVKADSISNITAMKMKFPQNPPAAIASAIRTTCEATNTLRASGGDNAPTIYELRDRIPSARNAQARVVSKPDLLARIYTMPANFGRVFRASIRSNQNNALASQLFIISRDSQKKLISSPDTLKLNLVRFLNEYRLISDAVDILDAKIINIGIDIELVADPAYNSKIVKQQVMNQIKKFMDIQNFQIDQPIVLSDIRNIAFNNPGVISINDIYIRNISGIYQNREYSSEPFDIKSNTIKGMIVGPPGSIFELRYPEFDIKGAAI